MRPGYDNRQTEDTRPAPSLLCPWPGYCRAVVPAVPAAAGAAPVTRVGGGPPVPQRAGRHSSWWTAGPDGGDGGMVTTRFMYSGETRPGQNRSALCSQQEQNRPAIGMDTIQSAKTEQLVYWSICLFIVYVHCTGCGKSFVRFTFALVARDMIG